MNKIILDLCGGVLWLLDSTVSILETVQNEEKYNEHKAKFKNRVIDKTEPETPEQTER